MASIKGFAHVTLTVRNLRTSEAWYRRVFEMERVMQDRTTAHEEILLLHRPSGTVLGLRQHRAGVTARFDSTRTGLDHLAFTVPDAVALVDWRQRLADLGVECSGLVQHRIGTVVALHDPDHIPIELHCPAASLGWGEDDGERAEDEGSEQAPNGSGDPRRRPEPAAEEPRPRRSTAESGPPLPRWAPPPQAAPVPPAPPVPESPPTPVR